MWQVMWKEFLELRQNPRIFGVVIVAPVVQLTLLGYAATTDINNVPVVVADGDRSASSRDLIARFEGSPYFAVAATLTTVDEVEPYLQDRRAWMALSIPADYEERLSRRESVTLQVIADGTDSNSTTVALGYATSLIGAVSEEITAAILGPGGGVDPQIRVWFNPRLESRYFMLPGILALMLLVVTSNLSSMAIVREREVGTYEQLSVTPLTRWGLIVGKLLPYGVIGVVDVLLVVAVVVWWFDVPLRGSFLLLLAMCVVYLLCTLSLGLLVSTISRSQQQAMLTATFFFLVPMIYLSGFIFPIENMPPVIQAVTYLIPLRYFLVIVRGIFLKGIGLEVLWPQALALFAWGVVALAFAAARARKSLD
jgi:ABC-2 type transport system permease protein